MAAATGQATLLGGRVAYHQPAGAYRTGIEPVLLAASIPARPGERVVEAGTGAGAALLCLAARVGGLSGLGLELDPMMVQAAQANVIANGQPGLRILAQDVLTWREDAAFDHAFANPPWHAPSGTQPPSTVHQLAKFGDADLVARWTAALAACLRRRGTLTLILPAASLPRGIAALTQADCGEITLFPLWPHAGQPAKLIILRGIRGGRGPCRLPAGLTLHGPDGDYDPAARRILWEAAPLMICAA